MIYNCLVEYSCLQEKDTEKEVSQIVWQHITHSIFLTNYGINFVLYCITGQNFRYALFDFEDCESILVLRLFECLIGAYDLLLKEPKKY